jgi:hypothetical protein
VFQIVQIVGSLLILSAFVAAQAGRLDSAGYRYLIANALGSAILTATALVAVEWGFILLEGVWALVSMWSIARKLKDRVTAARRK